MKDFADAVEAAGFVYSFTAGTGEDFWLLVRHKKRDVMKTFRSNDMEFMLAEGLRFAHNFDAFCVTAAGCTSCGAKR